MAGPSSPVGPPGVRRRDDGALVLDRDATERVVLALRVPVPVVGHEDPGERGVAVEDDAEHVERLPLLPVRGRVDPGDGGDVRVLGGDGDLQPDPAPVGHRREVVDDVQPRTLRRGDRAAAVEVVDAGDAGEQLEAQRLVVPQRLYQLGHVVAVDEVGDLAAVDQHALHRGVVGRPADGLDQRVGDLVEVAAVGPVGGVQRDGAAGLDPHQAAEAGGVAAAADAEGALAEAAARSVGALPGVLAAAVPGAGHRRRSGRRTALPSRCSIRNWPVRPSAAASSYARRLFLSTRTVDGISTCRSFAVPSASARASWRARLAPSGSCWILWCSLRIASISISGRGGQPGRYMSTGTMWSTPWTIA